MRIVVTGADGFLGWHLRCRMRALYNHEVVPVGRAAFDRLPDLAGDADAIIHIAGINRAPDYDLVEGNVALAEAVADAVGAMRTPRVVFANSIQAGNGTPYGSGKQRAAEVMTTAANAAGGPFVDVLLPNLFGEHGRPGYNSFVATFVCEVADGREPQVNDNAVNLLHVQDAAQALIDGLGGPSRRDRPPGEPHSVAGVLARLMDYADTYRSGEIPALDSAFERNLFNTFRAGVFESQTPIRFEKRSDQRGSLVETVKVHGGGGQTFFSTTVPGVTRGEHFHLSKIERFVVIGGQARIQLRRLLTDDVISFDVTGENPVAIDMPTLWAHNVTNTGADELLTLFWTDSIFDPAHPDTYPEPVETTQGAFR